MPESLTVQPLRDLVARQLDVHWDRFARDHPHLAAAVERVTLIQSAVQTLRADPEFQQALRQAAVDQATLTATQEVAKRVEAAVMKSPGL